MESIYSIQLAHIHYFPAEFDSTTSVQAHTKISGDQAHLSELVGRQSRLPSVTRSFPGLLAVIGLWPSGERLILIVESKSRIYCCFTGQMFSFTLPPQAEGLGGKHKTFTMHDLETPHQLEAIGYYTHISIGVSLELLHILSFFCGTKFPCHECANHYILHFFHGLLLFMQATCNARPSHTMHKLTLYFHIVHKGITPPSVENGYVVSSSYFRTWVG